MKPISLFVRACALLSLAVSSGACAHRTTLSPRGIINPPGKAGIVATGVVLVPNVPYSSNQNILIRNQDSSGRDYDLLSGPYPATGPATQLTVRNGVKGRIKTEGRDAPRTSMGLLARPGPQAQATDVAEVVEGNGDQFLYVIGKMPPTSSRRVIIGTPGTEYAVYIKDSANQDLVCVLDSTTGSPVQCVLRDGNGVPTPHMVELVKGQYVKVTVDGQGSPSFGPVLPIPGPNDPDPDGVRPFLQYVHERAQAAGLEAS